MTLRSLLYATKVYPDVVEAWINLGAVYNNVDINMSESKRCYDEATGLDPSNSKLWHDKGLVFKRLNKLQDAISCYDECLRLSTGNNGAWCDKAFAHNKTTRLQEYDQAEGCYDEILKIEPNNADAINGKGCVQVSKGNCLKAISFFVSAKN